MPRTCIAQNCEYEYKKEIRIKIFSFPKDKTLQYLWLRNMKVRETYKPSAVSSFGICEQHFLKKCCYDYHLGAQLKPNAVPTLLLPDNSRNWQKVAPDSEALLNEENEESTQSTTAKDARPRVEHDHSYLEESTTTPSTKPSPKKKPTAQNKADVALLKSEITDLKQQICNKNIQLKRLEDKVRKNDSKRGDLEYAVEKLKAILWCCECGLKPDSEAELARMLKRKSDGEGSSSKKVKTGSPQSTAPTQVVCRNDLVVGLTWKQLFARVHSLAQE